MKLLEQFRLLPAWVQWMPFVIVLLSGLLIGAVIDLKNVKPAAQESKHSRPTFTTSVQELVDRYNNIAAQIDRSHLLPPANALEDGGKNEKFHVLRHAVKPNIYLTIEVDNATGFPFSLGVTAAPTNNDEMLSLLGVLPTIGATIFGKGEKAGVIVNECTKATDPKNKPASIRVDEFEVICAQAMGLWMAGISVPKS